MTRLNQRRGRGERKMHLKCETSFVIPWPVRKKDLDCDEIDVTALDNVKGIIDAYTHFEFRGNNEFRITYHDH